VNKNDNDKKNEIKVVWEHCAECQSKVKRFKDLEYKHRPGDDLAIRAESFMKNYKHKVMMENYEAYRKKQELEEVRAKIHREIRAADVKIAMQNKIDKIKKWKSKKTSELI